MVDHYHVWCDLKPGVKDLDLVDSVNAMLGHLKGLGKLWARLPLTTRLPILK